MKTREEDFAEQVIIGSTHDMFLFFTSKGRVHKIKGYEIPESSRSARGMNLVNLLQLAEGEKVTAVIPLKDFEEGLYLNMVTLRGISKRTELSAFKNIRKSGLNAVDLDEGDELVAVRLTDGNQTMMAATHNGMVIRYKETDVRSMGRNARGVRVIKLSDDDFVIGMIPMTDDKTVLTVTEGGYGKRTPVSEYNVQKRGGKGVRGHKISEKTGKLCSLRIVSEDEDLIVISSDGIIIRVRIGSVPVYGRTSGGVRIMRFKEDGAFVVNTATLLSSPDEEVEEIEISEEDKAAAEAEAKEAVNEPETEEETESDAE